MLRPHFANDFARKIGYEGMVDRVSTARQRLERAKAELTSPAVDMPCVQCRYFTLSCSHPAVMEIRADPVTGVVSSRSTMTAAEARAESGPCGPEGALFDSRSLPASVLVSMLSTSAGRWVIGLGGTLTLLALFD